MTVGVCSQCPVFFVLLILLKYAFFAVAGVKNNDKLNNARAKSNNLYQFCFILNRTLWIQEFAPINRLRIESTGY